MKISRRLATTFLLISFSKITMATSFTIYDARSAGMGGTGVASSQISSAPFSNPAMLAAQREREDFSLLIGLGSEATDNDDLLNDIEAFSAAFNNTPQDPAAALVALTSGFNKKLDIQANTFLSLGVALKKWAFAANANNYLQATVSIDEDLVLPNIPLRADFVFTGIKVKETGISIARKFGNLSVGVTPKLQYATTYDSRTDIANNSDIDSITKAITSTGVINHGGNQNLDIGLVYKFSRNWTLGIVQRNTLNQSYKTAGTNTVTLAAQTRAGLAYTRNFITLAVDYDLAENASIIPNGDKTQYLSTGIEVEPLESFKFRAGLKQNIANNSLDTYSLGIGFNVLAAQFDLAVVGNSNTVSAMFQMGMRW